MFGTEKKFCSIITISEHGKAINSCEEMTHSKCIQLEIRIPQMIFSFPSSSNRIRLGEVGTHGVPQVVPGYRECPSLKFFLVLLQEISSYLHEHDKS
jgi:hypothetical protein